MGHLCFFEYLNDAHDILIAQTFVARLCEKSFVGERDGSIDTDSLRFVADELDVFGNVFERRLRCEIMRQQLWRFCSEEIVPFNDSLRTKESITIFWQKNLKKANW